MGRRSYASRGRFSLSLQRRRRMWRMGLLILTVLGVHGICFAANWPSWRGPQGTGVADERDLPLNWSDRENVVWKAPLPGGGNSTPIVWGDHVFLTCAS